jgi:hypothetical protein
MLATRYKHNFVFIGLMGYLFKLKLSGRLSWCRRLEETLHDHPHTGRLTKIGHMGIII